MDDKKAEKGGIKHTSRKCFIGNRNIRNAKANWKEQIINSISQFCIMMGIVL